MLVITAGVTCIRKEHVAHTNVDLEIVTQYMYSLYYPRASVTIPPKLIKLLTDL